MHVPTLSCSLVLAILVASGLGMSPINANEIPSCTAATNAFEQNAAGAACDLANNLEKGFVYPAQGEAYAKALRDHVAAGDYAKLSGEEAARRITADLQTVASDGHLRVVVENPQGVPGGSGPNGFPALVEQGGWIAPGIAFIRINAFMPDDEETEEVARFMREHASAKAMIFDVRTNRGGGLAQMNEIFPWLFEKETRLVTMAMRRSVEEEHGTPFGEDATLRQLQGTPLVTEREHWAIPNGDPRLHDAKVFVLTSENTNSAAEHFALAMKASGRATLVGSRTSGANHFGGMIPLPGGYAAFIPVGRTYDPATGKDWEGTGVLPEVDVPPADALAWTLESLGIAKAEATRLSASHAPSGSMTRRR